MPNLKLKYEVYPAHLLKFLIMLKNKGIETPIQHGKHFTWENLGFMQGYYIHRAVEKGLKEYNISAEFLK